MTDFTPKSLTPQTVVTRRRLITWGVQAAALAAGSFLLSGCGGGGGGGTRGGSTGGETGAGNPGDPVSPEQRMAALTAVQDEYNRLCNGAISCSSRAVADYMLQMAAFQRVGIMPDGCVWGHFTDGQHYVVGNNLSVGTGGPRPVESAQARLTRAPEPLSGVPVSDKAFSFGSILNIAFPDGTESGYDLYDSFFERAGYECPSRSEANANLWQLKNMPELGFFNWFTHGGMLNLDGSMTHALMTNSAPSLETILESLPDLQHGNLVYYLGQYMYSRGKWAAENRFAITPAFITNYNWKFSQDSIVMIHACASDNAGFRAAFKQAGAALYGGWSKPVWVHNACIAMDWLLDYFIAANDAVPTPNPRNRAFDYKAILKYCNAKEVTVYDDPSEGGTVAFNFTKFRGEPGGVSPSITGLVVQEHLEQILIRGSFGSVAGKVLIGTSINSTPEDNYLPWRPAGTVTELEILEWTASEITAKLPRSGDGSAGYLSVKVGNRWGNTRALTRWTGKIRVLGDAYGTLALNSEILFSIRADIGSIRSGPTEPIIQPDTAFAAVPLESSWKWHAEGSNSATFPGPTTTKVDWSGDGEIKVPVITDPPANGFITIAGTLSRKDKEIYMMIAGGALQALDSKMVITDPNGTQTLTAKHSFGLPALLMRREGDLVGIRMTLDDELAIIPGTLQSTEASILPMADLNPQFAYTVQWDKIESEYDPHSRGGI